MPDVGVVDAVLVGLLVQEVEHVLDGEGQRASSVCRAKDGLEQVVHELLQRALWSHERKEERKRIRRMRFY